jgi:hypothetical protein
MVNALLTSGLLPTHRGNGFRKEKCSSIVCERWIINFASITKLQHVRKLSSISMQDIGALVSFILLRLRIQRLEHTTRRFCWKAVFPLPYTNVELRDQAVSVYVI